MECFIHISNKKRRKLDKKAEKGFVVGYIEDCKGYRAYIPSYLKNVVLSRDILFKKEKVVPNQIEIKSEGELNDTWILSDKVYKKRSEKRKRYNVIVRQNLYSFFCKPVFKW